MFDIKFLTRRSESDFDIFVINLYFTLLSQLLTGKVDADLITAHSVEPCGAQMQSVEFLHLRT